MGEWGGADMWAVHASVALLFIVLGIVFIQGKGAFLIAGYNTSSKAEKEKYNEKALCRFMGKMMFLFAVCFLVMILSDMLENLAFLWIGLGLFGAVVVFTLIYANTGNRFKNK